MLRQSSDEDDDDDDALSLKMSSNKKKSQFVQELVLSTLLLRNVAIKDDLNEAKASDDDVAVDEDSDQESAEKLSWESNLFFALSSFC